jgi:hypothetical protein
VFGFDFWYEVEWWFWQLVIHYKVILALMVADLFHWIMDITTKEHKNETRKLSPSKFGVRPTSGDD